MYLDIKDDRSECLDTGYFGTLQESYLQFGKQEKNMKTMHMSAVRFLVDHQLQNCVCPKLPD